MNCKSILDEFNNVQTPQQTHQLFYYIFLMFHAFILLSRFYLLQTMQPSGIVLLSFF